MMSSSRSSSGFWWSPAAPSQVRAGRLAAGTDTGAPERQMAWNVVEVGAAAKDEEDDQDQLQI
jgi:hypothetical protein